MEKMKRVGIDSHPSQLVDEQARDRLKYQSLLHDYLDLQKDFVSRKKKLQMSKQRKKTLLAEVRFLRRRHSYLLEMQSSKQSPEVNMTQQRNPDINKMYMEEISCKHKDTTLIKPSTLDEANLVMGDAKKKAVKRKANNSLIDEKKAGKKKITWQDPVSVKV